MRDVERVLVLGAGPVGLAASILLDAPAVGEVLGGHLDGPPAGPFYLWDTAPARRFLAEKLELPPVPRAARFGYLRDGAWTETAAPAERAAYYRRTRGLPETAAVPDSAMSDGLAGVLPVLDVDREQLRTELLRRAVAVRSKIHTLRFRHARWEVELDAGVVRVEHLVSTLPAPVFYRLAGASGLQFTARSKTFVLPWPADLLRAVNPGLPAAVEYAYVLDRTLPYDRVTRAGATLCFEFNEPVLGAAFLGQFSPEQVTRATNPFGTIVSALGPPPAPPGISEGEFRSRVAFVGRLARWRHGDRLHTALEQLYALRDRLPAARPG